MVGRWIAALLVVPALLFADNGRVSFMPMPDGSTGVSFPVSVLLDDEVRNQLGSGLTVTFAVAATDNSRRKTAARIEVRYDLWDEAYLVRKIDYDGAAAKVRLRSFDELQRWWRTTPVRLVRGGASRGAVDIELAVLPFSAAESRDAREWLAKGAGATQLPDGGAGGARSAAGDAAVPRGPAVIDALIGTSLSAKPLITFRWRGEAGQKER